MRAVLFKANVGFGFGIWAMKIGDSYSPILVAILIVRMMAELRPLGLGYFPYVLLSVYHLDVN